MVLSWMHHIKRTYIFDTEAINFTTLKYINIEFSKKLER